MANRLDKRTLDKRLDRLGIRGALADRIKAADRCFVVGMGPSITKVDPEGLRGEIVIGVNHILRTRIRPDLICVTDASRLDVANLSPDMPKLIVAKHVARKHEENLRGLDVSSDIELRSLTKSVLDIEAFDPELRQTYWGASVICDLVIPLAAYLGFLDTYVLGLDGARASFPSTYPWGAEKVKGPHDSKLFHLHERTVTLARRADLRVWNCSFGGVVAAFPKTPLSDILPAAVQRRPALDPVGQFIAMQGRVLQIRSAEGETGMIRLVGGDGITHLLQRDGTLSFAKDDGSDAFKADSRFVAECGFVRSDWLSLRIPDTETYVCRWDEKSGYLVRGPHDLFSPYFSSFRPFESTERANARLEFDRVLTALETIRNAVGNLMIRDDAND